MNRVSSIFGQLLQFFPRLEFEGALRQHKAERRARGFTCWQQFVAILPMPQSGPSASSGSSTNF